MSGAIGVDKISDVVTPKRCKPFSTAFKSPLRQNESKTSSLLVSDYEDEIHTLKKKIEQVNSEISTLEKCGYSTKELDNNIDVLHRYNDMKDAGQTLLGKLAHLQHVTVKNVYEEYGMDLND